LILISTWCWQYYGYFVFWDEDDIHYLWECPLYTNARMQLFMNITPNAVISIETLLFGSYNLTDETNLIVLTNVL
jgi:hypothetical protein